MRDGPRYALKDPTDMADEEVVGLPISNSEDGFVLPYDFNEGRDMWMYTLELDGRNRGWRVKEQRILNDRNRGTVVSNNKTWRDGNFRSD